MNKQINYNTEELLLKKFIEQNNNYFGIGLNANEIDNISLQILARKYTNLEDIKDDNKKRKVVNERPSTPSRYE